MEGRQTAASVVAVNSSLPDNSSVQISFIPNECRLLSGMIPPSPPHHPLSSPPPPRSSSPSVLINSPRPSLMPLSQSQRTVRVYTTWLQVAVCRCMPDRTTKAASGHRTESSARQTVQADSQNTHRPFLTLILPPQTQSKETVHTPFCQTDSAATGTVEENCQNTVPKSVLFRIC